MENTTPAILRDNPMSPDSQAQEQRWLTQARAGDQQAFTRLVQHYQKPVFNLCYRMLKDPLAAEDAAQEAFLRAYLKLHTYDPQRKFSTWLLSIAAHYCLDQLRGRRVNLVSWDDLAEWYLTPEQNAGASDHPEHILQQSETRQEVRDHLAALPADYRTPLILRYWHALSYEDIAAQMNISLGALKSRIFRAKRMLAQAA